tara:strand:+ start:305 stop:700 length:396 start_codon:yes stop_codon:yes gene_type:complete
MNLQSTKEIRVVLNSILKDNIILKQNNINVNVGQCTYNDDIATYKVEVVIGGKTKKEISLQEEKDALDYVLNNQLPLNFKGKIQLESKNKKYMLVGYKSQNQKCPYIMQDIVKSGKTYKITFQQMIDLFAK